MLRHFNGLGKKVTIRNTGHSVNGQTLTDGIQINIGGMKKLHFDKKNMEVTAGAGNSWDEVLRGIYFPKYCLPVFPNNPGQQIHIGGTASVGGLSPYSSQNGGFWNHVIRFKLVTMTGKIVECSSQMNEDIFRFALCGFGRIGVIAELTVKVVPSKKHILLNFMSHHNLNDHFNCMNRCLEENAQMVVALSEFSSSNIFLNIEPYLTTIGIEIDSKKKAVEIARELNKEIVHDFSFYGNSSVFNTIDIGAKLSLIKKKDVVYYYPLNNKVNQLGLCHPWGDFIIGKKSYPKFIEKCQKIMQRYGLSNYCVSVNAFHNLASIQMNGTECIKNLNPGVFPLSTDLEGEDYSYVFGIFLNVPPDEVKKSMKMIDEVTDLTYRLNGKRYLYGYHRLSSRQVNQQFGKNTIRKWNSLKGELDPKKLLNIGVIEHLD